MRHESGPKTHSAAGASVDDADERANGDLAFGDLDSAGRCLGSSRRSDAQLSAVVGTASSPPAQLPRRATAPVDRPRSRQPQARCIRTQGRRPLSCPRHATRDAAASPELESLPDAQHEPWPLGPPSRYRPAHRRRRRKRPTRESPTPRRTHRRRARSGSPLIRARARSARHNANASTHTRESTAPEPSRTRRRGRPSTDRRHEKARVLKLRRRPMDTPP
jgi:hypothetical protein